MRKIIIVFFCAVFACQGVFAAGVGGAISSLIAIKATQRETTMAVSSLVAGAGAELVAQRVATSEYRNTVQAVSAGLTALLTVGIAASTAPVWAGVLLTAGAVYATPIAVDSLTNWLFRSDGTVSVSGGSGGTSAADPTAGYNQPPANTVFVNTPSTASGWSTMTVNQVASPFRCPDGQWCNTAANSYSLGDCTSTYCAVYFGSPGVKPYKSNQVYVFPTDPAYAETTTPFVTVAAPVVLPLASAIAAVPASDLAKPVDPALLAAIANEGWKAAGPSAPIPYDASNPITSADVASWASANPSLVPTVSEVLSAPVAGSGSPAGTVLLPIPGAVGGAQTGAVTGTQTSTNTATGTTSNISLSIDWGQFIAPDVTTPSIESILDPLFNMWPDWKNFSFPPHASSCPEPSFTLPAGVLGGKTIVFDQMCIFLDYAHVREALQAAFTVVWAIVIVLIVMGA